MKQMVFSPDFDAWYKNMSQNLRWFVNATLRSSIRIIGGGHHNSGQRSNRNEIHPRTIPNVIRWSRYDDTEQSVWSCVEESIVSLLLVVPVRVTALHAICCLSGLGGHRSACSWALKVTCNGEKVSNGQLVNTPVRAL
ncbi:hypothetical protein TNCV_2728441 [Trichonephila clavipes]|nr:hypothetical protein TNCV_2728441 [Trichonephila clavipes]